MVLFPEVPIKNALSLKMKCIRKWNYIINKLFFNGREYFFKKGLMINEKYISSLTGDKKGAAMQLIRAVRLEWLPN
jgi:hypothetical protein